MARVLHVIPAIAARYGGPSAAAIGMCRALRDAGWDTLIATTDADGDHRLSVPLAREEKYVGLPAIFFRRTFSEAYKWSGGLSAWLTTHVADFDVVHVHAVFSHSSIAAGRACRHAAVPYIVRPLGTLDPWSVGRKPLRKRALLRLGAERLLTGAAAIHYTSAEEQRLAESVISGMPQGVVIPNGVDEAMFATCHGDRTAAPYVLYLGRLDEKKGIELLIKAFHDVGREPRFARWRLVIAGDGPAAYVEALKAIAAAGAARSRIQFRGWVSGGMKIDLVQGARLLALPSHQENFGIVVAEALAACVPVIVTRAVNLADDVERAGAGWITDRTVPAITRTLLQAMTDEADVDRRGRAGRALADGFRWASIAEALIAAYQGVMVTCAA